MRRRQDAARRLCALLDELAQPLTQAVDRATALVDHRRAARVLDACVPAVRELEHHVARYAALFTIVACGSLPGIVWRCGSRFESFTLRPCNGDFVVTPWTVAQRVCAGAERGSLAFESLDQAVAIALAEYFGTQPITPAALRENHLHPRWPSYPQ